MVVYRIHAYFSLHRTTFSFMFTLCKKVVLEIENVVALEIGICLLISETPTPLASANVGNGDTPSPPKKWRRLKWMVPILNYSKIDLSIVKKSA